MTTLLRSALTDAANGSNITTGNPGDPTAFNYVDTTGGTAVRDQTPGTSVIPMWAKLTKTSGGALAIGWNLAATSKQGLAHDYLWVPSLPSSLRRIGSLTTATPTSYADLWLTPSGALKILNNAGTLVAQTSSAISTSTAYRWEMYHDATNSAAGVWVLNVYAFGSTTPISGLSFAVTSGVSTGSGSLARAYYGSFTSGDASSGDLYVGDPAAWEGTSTEIGQYNPPGGSYTIIDDVGLTEPDVGGVDTTFTQIDAEGLGDVATPTLITIAPANPTIADFAFGLDAAFGYTPSSPSPVYTDIKGFWNAAAGASFQRGRSNEFDTRAQPGIANVVLNNADGRFTYDNAGGPYGTLQIRVPMRHRVTYAGITYPLWQGFVDRWGTRQDQLTGKAQISASDRLARIDGGSLQTQTTMRHLAITTAPCVALYPLDDVSALLSTAGDVSGQVAPPLKVMTIGTGGQIGTGSKVIGDPDSTGAGFTPTDGSNGQIITTDGYGTIVNRSISALNTTLSIMVRPNVIGREMWALIGLMQGLPAQYGLEPILGVDSIGRAMLKWSGGAIFGPTLPTTVPSHLAVSEDTDTSTISLWVNGVNVGSGIQYGGGSIGGFMVGGTGKSADGTLWNGDLAYVACFAGLLTAADLLSLADGTDGWLGEMPSDRFQRLMTDGGVPSTLVTVTGTGSSTLGPMPVAGGSLLDAASNVATDENGVVYASRGGVITLSVRGDRYNTPIGLTLDASKPGQVLTDFAVDVDPNLLINDLTVTRYGGASQRIIDQASINVYDRHDAQLTLHLADDTQVLSAGRWRVATSVPRPRSQTVTVDVVAFAASGGDVNALLTSEIGTRLKIINIATTQVAAGILDLFIEGIQYQRPDAHTFRMVFTTSPVVVSGRVFVLNDPTYGALSSDNRLAY